MKRFPLIATVLVFALLAGCKSTYYSAYEKFGVYKRDLLKKQVVAARDDQKDAQEQFKDALTQLQEITGFQGGELERRYRDLQSQYDKAAAKVEAVHNRVGKIQTVAEDLFTEWQKEDEQISTPSLRETSHQQLIDTRARYNELLTTLKQAESSMDPVLRKFHDYVLALKHSLNAQAIAALKGESLSIQSDIQKLIQDMNVSIAQADQFVKSLPSK